MQTFTVKISDTEKMTEQDIAKAIWQCSNELTRNDILVEKI